MTDSSNPIFTRLTKRKTRMTWHDGLAGGVLLFSVTYAGVIISINDRDLVTIYSLTCCIPFAFVALPTLMFLPSILAAISFNTVQHDIRNGFYELICLSILTDVALWQGYVETMRYRFKRLFCFVIGMTPILAICVLLLIFYIEPSGCARSPLGFDYCSGDSSDYAMLTIHLTFALIGLTFSLIGLCFFAIYAGVAAALRGADPTVSLAGVFVVMLIAGILMAFVVFPEIMLSAILGVSISHTPIVIIQVIFVGVVPFWSILTLVRTTRLWVRRSA